MMRILLMYFYNLINISGGAEKVLCNMANEFIDRGYEVSVVCCDKNNGLPFYYLNKSVNFVNLNGSGKEYKVPLYLKFERECKRVFGILKKDDFRIKCKYYNILNRLEKLINEINPNIIITYETDSLYVLKTLLDNKFPTIAMLHLDAKVIFNKDMSKELLKSFNKVNYIQVLNESNIDIIKKYCNNVPIIYIPNVVQCNTQIKSYNVYHKVITVGRITKEHKRQYLLLDAFNKIKDEQPKWTIEVVGGTWSTRDDNYKKELIKFTEDNNFKSRVVFTGSITNVIERLQQSDIFAFPSAYEGMPLALTEAMAAGLPAIGYKSCPSVNKLIVDGYNGFLCEDGIDDFAEKLKILMEDAELRKKMGQNARESMKQFAPEKIWNEWEALINKVVTESKK